MRNSQLEFDVNLQFAASATLSYLELNTGKYEVFEIITKEDAVKPFLQARPNIRELKMETFSGRRQLQPDVTSRFVQYCICSCSPYCRRAPVGDVKLVCLALWREREYLTFISIRFVAFSNQNFADYRS